jgi:hypothetical protein
MVKVGKRTIELSNLKKILFPDAEIIKAELIEYYLKLAPTFPNVYFNLGLVHAMNEEHTQAVESLAKYRELATAEEGMKADELLASLKRLIAAKK